MCWYLCRYRVDFNPFVHSYLIFYVIKVIIFRLHIMPQKGSLREGTTESVVHLVLLSSTLYSLPATLIRFEKLRSTVFHYLNSTGKVCATAVAGMGHVGALGERWGRKPCSEGILDRGRHAAKVFRTWGSFGF